MSTYENLIPRSKFVESSEALAALNCAELVVLVESSGEIHLHQEMFWTSNSGLSRNGESDQPGKQPNVATYSIGVEHEKVPLL